MERILFVDMNSFFASVEQVEDSSLQGKPVIVAPLMADSTVALAASYEAKAFGIKTGTSLRDAKRLCPHLQIVLARPTLYREYHQRILEALRRYFVSIKVLSVDEMACRIGRFYGTPEREIGLARAVKADLFGTLGLRSSVGIAPNVFLAKVAGDMMKPDGLTVLDEGNLPDALFRLELRDLPGIGAKMHARLLRGGIASVRELCTATPMELRKAWGGVNGERWWHMLRGSQVADYGGGWGGGPLATSARAESRGPRIPDSLKTNSRLVDKAASSCRSPNELDDYDYDYDYDDEGDEADSEGIPESEGGAPQKSMSHSHVLPPAFRTESGARQILLRLFSRCLKRLRAHGQSASVMTLTIKYRHEKSFRREKWTACSGRRAYASDDITWVKVFREMLACKPEIGADYYPYQAHVVFTELALCADVTPCLFADSGRFGRLCETVDKLNARFGYVVDLASVYKLRSQAPYRIPFGATMLDPAR